MVENAQRRSIEVDGFGHGGQPIPAASRIANIVMSGGISGQGAGGAIPDDVAEQCRNMFVNVERILAAAGAAPKDVIRMTVYVKDRTAREHINREWLRLFPDEHSRPARHTHQYDYLPANALVQCEIMAVIAS